MKKRKSLFFQYFISYIGISVICTAVFGFVLYHFSVVNMETEEKSNRYSSVTQSLGQIDSILNVTQNITAQLSGGGVIGGGASNEANSIISDSIIAQNLANLEANISVPIRVALLPRGSKDVYLSDGKRPFSQYSEVISENADITMSQLYSTANSTKTVKAQGIVSNEDATDINQNVATAFIYPIPPMDMLPQASLIFTISQNDLKDTFENYLGEGDRNIYLLDNMMKTLYSSEEIEISEEYKALLFHVKGTGILENANGEKNKVVVRSLSENSGYSLITVMHTDDFYSFRALFRQVALTCVGLLLLLIVLIALLLTIRNLKPIRNMAKQYRGVSEGSNYNELERIQMHIDSTERENFEYSNLVDMQRPYVLQTCILNILKGKIGDKAEFTFQCQCANVNLSHKYFQVVIVTPLNAANAILLIQTAIIICDGIETPGMQLYTAEMITEKQLAIIINSDFDETSRGVSIGVSIGEQIIEKLKAFGYNEASVGVGEIYTSAEDVHNSFVEGLVIANEHGKLGKVTRFSEFSGESDSGGQSISAADLALLEQALRQGDKAAAWELIDSIVGKLSLSDGSLIMQKYSCYDLANTIIKTASRMNVNLLDVEIHELGNYGTLENFANIAKTITKNICEQSEKQKEHESSVQGAKIIDYVKKNFKSEELSLELTAEHFDFSASYMSRFFKQATGLTFIQYVTDLRMNYIKDALAGSDMQIKDIIASAGYLNVASFVRKFKASEGLTPGQYREHMKNGRGGA